MTNDNNPKDTPSTLGRCVGGDDTPAHADLACTSVVGGDGVAVTRRWVEDAPTSRRQRQAEAREEYETQRRSEFRGDDGGEL